MAFLQRKKTILGFLVVVLSILTYAYLSPASSSIDAELSPTPETDNPPADSILISIMRDAPDAQQLYSIKSTIETNYKVSSADIYFYDIKQDVVNKVTEKLPVYANVIDYSFQATYSTAAYAIVHITYGPNFLFDRHSEAVCIVPFDESNIFDSFPCDPLTTSKYMIASTMVDASFKDIFSAQVAKEVIHLHSLPDTIGFQQYLAIHQILLAHVAETNGYLKANQKGQYLSNIHAITQLISDSVRKYRRLNISMLDKLAEKVDKSMVNLTYRIYMTLDGLMDRHIPRLPRMHQNNQLLVDFFTGTVPFILTGENTDIAVSVAFENDQLTFNYWPWFTGVYIQFDGEEEPQFVTDRKIGILTGSSYVDIQGASSIGKYPKMRYSIAQKHDFESGLMTLGQTDKLSSGD